MMYSGVFVGACLALASLPLSSSFVLLPSPKSVELRVRPLWDAPPVTAAPSSSVSDAEIPTKLPSAVGMDYIPLATMLATGQLAEADQFTRDALIKLCGAKDKGRTFVYFAEVKNIPKEDLATIERLWNKFSGGKFGYSVQRKIWKRQKGDFEVREREKKQKGSAVTTHLEYVRVRTR